MIDESEHERAAHRRSHNPGAQTPLAHRDEQAHDRSGKDDDVDEEITGRTERDVRTGMRGAVDEAQREMAQDDGGERLHIR